MIAGPWAWAGALVGIAVWAVLVVFIWYAVRRAIRPEPVDRERWHNRIWREPWP